MKRSDYRIVKVEDNKAFLVDLDKGNASVTNDAENVFSEVVRQYPGHRVIYRDSMGQWDEIAIDGNGDVIFVPYQDESF
jgi:hypothetical protein